MEYAIKIGISLITVFIFFVYYFRNFVFSRSIIWQSKFLFIGLIFSDIAIIIQLNLLQTDSNFIRSFVYAALIEESLRFLFIYYRIKNSSETFTVVEGIFDSILIGLGFSFAENLHYSVQNPGFVILLRCISSVPMHVFASGIMGYFLSYRYHCEEVEKPGISKYFSGRRAGLIAVAFLIPFVFHGIFDYILFTRGHLVYFLPVLLIFGFLFLEFLIAEGRLVISNNILSVLEIDADDMDIIQHQKNFEKWMKNTQVSLEPPPGLFQNRWSLPNTLMGVSLTLLGGGMAVIYFLNPALLSFIKKISKQELVALLILLPLSIGLLLIVAEKINYLFFREHMLQIPEANMVSVNDVAGDRSESICLALDIMEQGLFLPGVLEYEVGEKIKIGIITKNRKEISLRGVVRWRNEHDVKMPIGVVLRFSRTDLRFKLFRLLFIARKVNKRLMNSLRV